MAQLGARHNVWEVTALKRQPNHDKALEMLQRVAAHVRTLQARVDRIGDNRACLVSGKAPHGEVQVAGACGGVTIAVRPLVYCDRARQCTKLCEFLPKNDNLLGININRSVIKIRCECPQCSHPGHASALSPLPAVRPAHDTTSFYPYEHTLGTMLHELCHMRIGPHNQKFYAVRALLLGPVSVYRAVVTHQLCGSCWKS